MYCTSAFLTVKFQSSNFTSNTFSSLFMVLSLLKLWMESRNGVWGQINCYIWTWQAINVYMRMYNSITSCDGHDSCYDNWMPSIISPFAPFELFINTVFYIAFLHHNTIQNVQKQIWTSLSCTVDCTINKVDLSSVQYTWEALHNAHQELHVCYCSSYKGKLTETTEYSLELGQLHGNELLIDRVNSWYFLLVIVLHVAWIWGEHRNTHPHTHIPFLTLTHPLSLPHTPWH